MYDYDYVTPDFSTSGLEETLDLAGNVLGGIAIFGVIVLLISIAVAILLIISNWKIFEKGKRNGWESLVPVHNIFVLLEIAGTPTWHIFLFFLPVANVYAIFRMYIDLAHKFGKSTGFGIASVLFNYICMPILAFSKNAKYESNKETKTETDNMNEMQMRQTEVTTNPTQTMMNVENVVPMQTVEVAPMQPTYTEPVVSQTVVTEPVAHVQTPVQTVPVTPEPVVQNTVVMPEQNNNQNGTMM